MTTERQIAYVKHPVSAKKKAELVAKGFRIIDARFKPKGADEIEGGGQKIELGTDSGAGFSDDQLRAAIKEATGKAPHHKLGREKLIEAFNALNMPADQEEEASNGLTRREIEADLVAMNVEFNAEDALEDLAALRDLEREQRA
ncbi:hypothetical protein [Nitratireductor sp. GZWM139]|uniref:hypothetical protein n=1 Tax=Nitratireductor sp. GZWM139 TaxID=2950541 RepID=UPI0024BE759D|nr:hypothetical protein [Nitratireductor sp. GZWM139]MDJ1465662.1 hypothetical protein [Nitratireductor sp. GZWM139]